MPLISSQGNHNRLKTIKLIQLQRRSSRNKMDYQSELQKLKEQEESIGGEFWKPEAGQYKIKSLGELEDGTPYVEEGKVDQPRKQINVSVNEKEHQWSMPHGKTPASTYGQLCQLATARNNTLKDVEFSVIVVGSGQNKRFTIVM